MQNPLKTLVGLGQSVWYDNLSRALLRSGELEKLILEDGVSGVTTNPSIFEHAIGTGKVYDEPLHELVDEGRDAEGIYEGLVVEDVREACDLLSGVYERSHGEDGYVSLEVSPELAHDAKRTVAEAKRLFALVDRPNVMIKVPATPEGFPAVRDLIACGLNVNVTLIFSLAQYRNAADAYITGLERLAADGGDVSKPASVASLFVSRVDTAVDERIEDLVDPQRQASALSLKGKTGIANAKLAYELFKETFHGPRFQELGNRGAKAQRPLWASTSVKNPAYKDTLYVEALIGPETVNTIPPVALDAFRRHGVAECGLTEGLTEAREVFATLEHLGVPLDEVMADLLEKGLAAFTDSYRALLEGIAAKRRRLLRGWGHRSASLGSLQPAVDEALRRCDDERTSEKLWSGDTSLWAVTGSSVREISKNLGWLNVPETMKSEIDRLKAFAKETAAQGFTDAVLLGMGTGVLAPDVFGLSFAAAQGMLRLHTTANLAPQSILDLERSIDLTKTVFIAASKSGKDLDVSSLYKYFRNRVEERVGQKAGERFIAVTDPGTPLAKLAAEEHFRKTFLNPPDMEERFSALSYFGLAPAALIGADIERLLMRALQSAESSTPDVPALESPGMWLGVIIGEAAKAGIDKLTLILSPPVESFGRWIERLVAESLGDGDKRVIPVHGEAPGPKESYGKDRIFIYLRVDGDSTFDAFVSEMERAGFIVVTLRLHGPYDIGREMFRWQFATAVAAHVLNVNPFGRAGADEAVLKRLRGSVQDEGGADAPRVSVADPGLRGRLTEFFAKVREGDYVAVNAYLAPLALTVDVLGDVRSMIRNRFKTATTLRFGARFRHLGNQIGADGNRPGLFLQIIEDSPEDAPVPGEEFTFGALNRAYARAEYHALERSGLRALRIHVPEGAALSELRDALTEI
jgi:transaldolase/glucose-6-phosphate isomerase